MQSHIEVGSSTILFVKKLSSLGVALHAVLAS